MTKQEEIRERMRPFTTSCSYCGSNNCPFEGNPSCINCNLNLDQALQYLHSRVVMKVERELPVPVYSGCCKVAQQEMLKAGYEAVEPLVDK